jgi:hypothetical protein
VQLYDISHQRQSESKSAVASIEHTWPLRKEVKNPGQEFLRNPHAGITNGERRVSGVGRKRQRNATAGICVFGSVCQQVDDYFDQPIMIAAHPHRAGGRQSHRQLLSFVVKQPADRVERMQADLCKVDRFAFDLQLSGRQANTIAQVVQQACDLAQLAPHHFRDPYQPVAIQRGGPDKFDAVL